jgi:hypothetical protein
MDGPSYNNVTLARYNMMRKSLIFVPQMGARVVHLIDLHLHKASSMESQVAFSF